MLIRFSVTRFLFGMVARRKHRAPGAVAAGLVAIMMLAVTPSAALAQSAGPAAGKAADAAAPVVVRSGQSVELVRGQAPITVTKDGKLGHAAVVTPAADIFALMYAAPMVSSEETDTIEFTGGPSAAAGSRTVKLVPVVSLTDGSVFEASGKILGALLVLAIVLESALALLFNWRPFLDTINRRATQPLISFIVAYVFVTKFDFDAVSALFSAYGNRPVQGGYMGPVITAMVIAGGSSAVNRLMQSLGFRATSEETARVPKPAPDKAWIAVTLRRKNAVGPVQVAMKPAAAAAGPDRIIGTIPGTAGGATTSPVTRLFRYFLTAKDRFPPAGGHTVDPDTYTMELVGLDAQKAALRSVAWGPYAIEKGAIIDLELEL